MNFYNPYFYSMPSNSTSILSKISFSSILNGANKTLNIVNQTIPLVKQVSPIYKNFKTMFNLMNEFKKIDTKEEIILPKLNDTNGPTFFI